jgi:hypothetical protein
MSDTRVIFDFEACFNHDPCSLPSKRGNLSGPQALDITGLKEVKEGPTSSV